MNCLCQAKRMNWPWMKLPEKLNLSGSKDMKKANKSIKIIVGNSDYPTGASLDINGGLV